MDRNHQNRHVTPEVQLYFKTAMKEAIVETMEQFGLHQLKEDVTELQKERIFRQGEDRQKGKNIRNLTVAFTIIQIVIAAFFKFYK